MTVNNSEFQCVNLLYYKNKFHVINVFNQCLIVPFDHRWDFVLKVVQDSLHLTYEVK